MTIRKPNHDGNQAHGLSYPSLPSSPVQQDSQTNASLVYSEESVPIPRQGEGKVQDLVWKGDESTKEYKAELPSSLSFSYGASNKDPGAATSNVTASLPARPIDITPRSSFDSHRSHKSISPGPVVSDAQEDRYGKSKLASNNPFLQHLDSSASVPMRPIGEESSAAIWADRPEERPWKSQIEHQVLPIWSEQAKDSRPNIDRVSSKDSSLSGQSLQTITSTRFAEEVPFDDPWNGLATPQTRGPQLDVNNSSVADLNTISTVPSALKDVSQEQNAIGEVSCLLEQKSINDQLTLNAFENEKGLPPLPARDQADFAPALPPRKVEHVGGQPPPKPPRPHVNTAISGDVIHGRAQNEVDRRRKQRSETYQIRLVNWFDASSKINPRRSPIMVQNANGPCPLLALVNALVLSTPSDLDTALLDTLERREQVSLGLLLDAVIDELMSGRRGDAAQNLPDVSELYAFLVNLHTGMNVNPCFLPKEADAMHILDTPIPGGTASLSDFGKAGGFESTREMKLYSTFGVPLIHGWLPSSVHPACAALRRSAKTYEDAQNLMFAEEELENKLSRQGLDQDEQGLLQDIASVKYFLSASATQLTGYGLNQITESLRPGSIAILFRNDHFSTLYRNPRSGQLFTLVTDMGYAGHDEVVWESLVDVSGEGCEFFAGDFRVVGNNDAQFNRGPTEDNNGWTTVGRSDRHGGSNSNNTAPDLSSLHLGDSPQNPTSPKAEQEDHDLALALQLQEEEEERERQETAARRREDELSHAFLSSQPASRGHGAKRGPEIRPSIPPRGSASGRAGGLAARGGLRSERRSGASSSETRPPVQPEDGEEAPPPTYEQAASGPAYHPPPNHPAHPHASPTSPNNLARSRGPQRDSSAYTQNSTRLTDSPTATSPASSPFTGSPSAGSSRTRSSAARSSLPRRGGPSGVEGAPGVYRRNGGKVGDEGDRDRDCNIM